MAKIHRKQTTKTGPNGERIKIESRKWYGTIRLPDRRYKQIPLSEDYRASLGLLRRAQTEQDNLRAWGLTAQSKRRTEPLTIHIAEYRKYLESKGNSPKHIALAVGRIQRVIRALKATRISDLTSGKVANLLERWRREGMPAAYETRKGRTPAPLSRQSSNDYAANLKAFSRWLWSTEVVESDVLRGLKPLNVKVDRRHIRRALSDVEISQLIHVTHDRGETIVGKDWQLTGPDRSMLYRVASFTGLRASELRSLCPASIDIEAGTIRVAASNTKNRRETTLPLHPALLASLKPWLADKPTGQPLWRGRWNEMAADVIRRDLKLAEIEYRNERGICDFHSLRHSFVSGLARAGVHITRAKELARHSSIELTANFYTHTSTDELRESLGKLPSPSPTMCPVGLNS